MKKLSKIVALLLAGALTMLLFTACSGGGGNDAATAEFEAKVEQAYMAELNKTFGEFENDAAIKKLAVDHIGKMAGKETLSYTELWAKEYPTETTQNQVMICYDPNQSTFNACVKFCYEADKAEMITPDETNINDLKHALEALQLKALLTGKKADLTALGVGAKTINGKTYVAIGFRVNTQ